MSLFVVSTPIGNLKDITFNAIEVLKSSDLILSEDTRTTSSLLAHYNIFGKKIINFTDYTKEEEYTKFIEIAKTSSVVLVSEAGTPAISDPGYTIVKKAHEQGVKLEAIVGACSLTAAISVSGLPFTRFAFLGFYTKSFKNEIVKILQNKMSVAIFVPARDIAKVLQELQPTIGEREICIARELTKLYEDIKKGTTKNLLSHYKDEQKLKGEAVLLISFVEPCKENQDLKNIIIKTFEEKPFLKNDGVSLKFIAEILKTYEADFIDFSKKDIYNVLLEVFNIKDKNEKK